MPREAPVTSAVLPFRLEMIIVLFVAAADRRSGCRWPRRTASARSGGHESLWSRPYYSVGTASRTSATAALAQSTSFCTVGAPLSPIAPTTSPFLNGPPPPRRPARKRGDTGQKRRVRIGRAAGMIEFLGSSPIRFRAKDPTQRLVGWLRGLGLGWPARKAASRPAVPPWR